MHKSAMKKSLPKCDHGKCIIYPIQMRGISLSNSPAKGTYNPLLIVLKLISKLKDIIQLRIIYGCKAMNNCFI